MRTPVAKKSASTFNEEHLLDMPLTKGRVAKALLVLGSQSFLSMDNLAPEAPVMWRLGLARTEKSDAASMAESFSAFGSRHVNALSAGVAAEPALVAKIPEGGAPAIQGNSEFGLQTPDEHEYFLSKFGDLVGIVIVKRTAKGWSAGLSKSTVPRVLSKDAVANGVMPPQGHSALPKSLESAVPPEYHYWKAAGDEARSIRDAFVDSAFFSDDCVKAVDGELRKVEVKYFLYEPPTVAPEMAKAAPRAPSFSERVAKIIPPDLMGQGFTPMTDGLNADWLENLDKNDAPGQLAILSPPDRSTSAREMVRAAKSLKGDFLLEHNDTHANRAAFAAVGPVFKLAGEPSRIFCSSFSPSPIGVRKMADGPVQKTVEYQGIKVDIDRPVGFVQTGKDENGGEWSRTYFNDYGFIPKTNGGDGGSLDVFIGGDPSAATSYWATQQKQDGTFDEYKVFLGFGSQSEALDAFAKHIPQRFLQDMTAVPVNAIKSLLNLDFATLAKRLGSYVRKINGISYDQLRSILNDALRDAYPPDPKDAGNPCAPCYGVYTDDLFDDSVVFSKDGKTYQDAYTFEGGAVALAGAPVEVVRGWMPMANVGQPAAQKNFRVSGAKKWPWSVQDVVGLIKGQPLAEVPMLRDSVRALTSAAETEIAKRVVRVGTIKAEGDEHYVLGIVLAPDEMDAQNDVYSADEVRKASERFMEHHRNMGLMHKGHVNDKVQIVENYLAPADFNLGDTLVKKGTWMMACRINDPDLWAAVKSGELTGFSIGGSAIRQPTKEGV